MRATISESLGACPDCDALYRRRRLAPGETAYCPRCGARLYASPRISPDQTLALVTAALLSFAIANGCPIVDLTMHGLDNSVTLAGSVEALWQEGRTVVALLVFATTQLFPLLDLAAMLALLLAFRRARRPSWFAPLLRFVLALRPWGMTEVFMLGVLVAVVKLSHMAHVLPGTALWAFGALTVLLASILAFDPRGLWDEPVS